MYGREFHEWQEACHEFGRHRARAESHLEMAAEHAEFALVSLMMAEGALALWEKRWTASTATR